MRGVVCASLAEAAALEARLDSYFGLPRPPDGERSPLAAEPGDGWTTHAASDVAHPSRDGRRAVIFDPRCEAAYADIRADAAALAIGDATTVDRVILSLPPSTELGAEWETPAAIT